MKSFYSQIIGRRLVLTAFLILSAVSVSFAQVAGGAPRTADLALQVTEFEVNGLKVLVKKRANSPTVAAGLFIRGGARNITEKESGIESLMLSAATEAGKKFPRDVVRREVSRTGSGISASAGKDFSVVSLTSTRKDFERMWEIFADVTINPAFSAQDVERVREQLLTGLRENETTPDNFLDVLEERYVYAGHPYANDMGGTLETIGRFSVDDLRRHHQKIMRTSQLLLVLVGDLDAEDLKKRIGDSFGKLPRGDYKEIALPSLDFSKPTLDVVQRPLPTNYVRGVFDAPQLGSADYYAMRVAMTILQSLVYQEVRVRRQLSYAPDAELGSTGANTANIYVTAVEANEAVDVMLDQIENLRTQLINDEAIGEVAGFFLTTYYLKQETNAAQAVELARYELIGGGWRNSFLFLDKIREVKDTDIRRVSQKYMKNIRFVVIGNPTSIDRNVFLRK